MASYTGGTAATLARGTVEAMDRRRFLHGLLATPILASPLLLGRKLRCDADWVEGEIAAGRPVTNRRLVFRRAVQVDGALVMDGCDVKSYAAACFRVGRWRTSAVITNCVFNYPDVFFA